MKSPSSMRNGRFNTSKYRDKFQKMGLLYTHNPPPPSKKPMPLLHARASKKNILNEKNNLFFNDGRNFLGHSGARCATGK
jgi:hypothetical protein